MLEKREPMAMTIFTVGHSTRSADEFGQVLAAHGIERLVDVRQFPGSRRYPHFGAGPLAASLAEQGIEYRHEVALGGRRRATADSPNGFWRNASFRAYADYMATPEFAAALDRMMALAAEKKTAIMCAEAVPWRCHRWLISDALAARGIEVVHLIDAHCNQPHVLNPNAQLDAHGKLTYPAAAVESPQKTFLEG
jgi:uncharacterized protein (DUF488 family)